MATAAQSTMGTEQTSRDWLRLLSILIAVIGTAISGYIVLAELTNTATVCPQNSTFNCDLVQHSIYSKVGPIPVAYLGLAGYVLILLALLLEARIPFLQDRGRLVVFALTLFGVMFSGYLTAIEAFVLKAWCIWCLGSAIVMLVLFVVSLVRLWRGTTEGLIEDDEEA